MVMISGLWLVLFFKELFNGIREAERKSNGKEKEKETPITYDKTLQVFDDLINKLKQLDNFKGKEIVVDISARDGYSYIRVYARQESKNSYSSETLVDVKSFESSISAITDLYMSAILELNKYFEDTGYSRKLTGFVEFKTDDLVPLICKNCENRAKNSTYCTLLEREIEATDYCFNCEAKHERNDI